MSLRRPVLALVVVAGAPFAGLAAVAGLGLVTPRAAIVAGVLMAAALAGLAFLARAATAALARHLNALADGEDRPAPAGPLALSEVRPALARLRRVLRQARVEREAAMTTFGTVLDAVPDALILLDRDRRVVRANLPARTLFAALAVADEARPLDGRPLASLLRDPTLMQTVEAALGDGAEPGSWALEVRMPVPHERVFAVGVRRLSALPAAGPLGEAELLVVLSDLTDRRRGEQLRSDFVANASHELRTPLASLTGFIETLQGPARDDADARERFLAIMLDQANRMTRLVEDLLSLSRIEMHEHTPPKGRVALGPLLQDVAQTLQAAADRRRMTIALGIEPDLPEVAGDRDELTQVFQNLVDNAVKYGRPDSEIAVDGIIAPDGAVRVAVRDRGEGIARQHLPRLAERFYRVDTNRSRELGGTGLGLAIVKHIVNRHRGRLAIDSTVGEGSTFAVSLPAAPPAGDESTA